MRYFQTRVGYVSPFGDDMMTFNVYGQRLVDMDIRVFVVRLSKRFYDLKRTTKYFQQVINDRLPCGYRFLSVCNDVSSPVVGLAMLRGLASLRCDDEGVL